MKVLGAILVIIGLYPLYNYLGGGLLASAVIGAIWGLYRSDSL